MGYGFEDRSEEITRLTQERDQCDFVIADMVQQVVGSRNEITRLTRELEIADKFHTLSVKERDLERVKNDRLTQERDDLKIMMTIRDSTIARLTQDLKIMMTIRDSTIARLTQERDDLTRFVEMGARALEMKDERIEKLTQERDELTRTRSLGFMTIESLNKELQEARQEIERLSESFRRFSIICREYGAYSLAEECERQSVTPTK